MFLGLFGLTLALSLPFESAHAQANRTWVSQAVGDDANPCSRTAPCHTFAGAYTKTAAGGEIDVLDPGGYGALTINKSLTIDGGGGQVASVQVAGTNGIVVAAQPTDLVILRNIRINGLLNAGTPGINGISYMSGGTLVVENCMIFGFGTAGINVSTPTNASLNIRNTTITNAGIGINLAPAAGTLVGEMDHSTVQTVATNGITTATGSVLFTVTHSSILSVEGTGVSSGGSGTVLNVDSSSITNNNTAFATVGGLIRISRNTIYDNNTNYAIAGGTIATSGDNIVAINGATLPNGTIVKQ
jgi:hypothetical protein